VQPQSALGVAGTFDVSNPTANLVLQSGQYSLLRIPIATVSSVAGASKICDVSALSRSAYMWYEDGAGSLYAYVLTNHSANVASGSSFQATPANVVCNYYTASWEVIHFGAELSGV
jgi:cytosine/adenosine deaminase-related metal-dependent hydrolase